MGATVTTGKAVMGFINKGTVYYILFEKMHESNVFPHSPHWECFALGNYQDVMQAVFRRASAAASFDPSHG